MLKKSYPVKIVLFRYDAEIIITLSTWYDECRHPGRGSPVADRRLKIQKNLSARRALERP